MVVRARAERDSIDRNLHSSKIGLRFVLALRSLECLNNDTKASSPWEESPSLLPRLKSCLGLRCRRMRYSDGIKMANGLGCRNSASTKINAPCTNGIGFVRRLKLPAVERPSGSSPTRNVRQQWFCWRDSKPCSGRTHRGPIWRISESVICGYHVCVQRTPLYLEEP